MLNYFRIGLANFDLQLSSGVAAGLKTWSETHVSGGGGGNNSSISINSYVRTRNEFFLIGDDGEEESVSTGGHISLRAGQSAAVIYVKRVSTKGTYSIYSKNYASGDPRELGGLENLTRGERHGDGKPAHDTCGDRSGSMTKTRWNSVTQVRRTLARKLV